MCNVVQRPELRRSTAILARWISRMQAENGAYRAAFGGKTAGEPSAIKPLN